MSGSGLADHIHFTTSDITNLRLAAEAERHNLNVVTVETWTTARFKLPDDIADKLIDMSFDGRDDREDFSVCYWYDAETIVFVNWVQMFHKIAVTIYSKTQEHVRQVLTDLRIRFPKLEVRKEEPKLQIKVWANSDHGPRAYERFLDSMTYEEIKHNYTASVQHSLGQLVKWTPPTDANGKLMIWHGIPGTGKTWAVRMLAKEWSSWCTANFIADPEQFFGADPNYLFRVAMADDGQDELEAVLGVESPKKVRKWRLLILEDAGELISQDAKLRSGQGLSRFLNLTDGLLGQGLRTLILITTNEEDDKLHDAVKRPGRCLASVKFDPLTPAEAAAWLTNQGYTSDQLISKAPTKLCELYDLVQPVQIAQEREDKVIGFAKH